MPVTCVREDQDTPALRAERQVIAAMLNALHDLHEVYDIDISQTVTTFLANLAAEQSAPHLTLRRLLRIASDKLSYMLRYPAA